MARKKRSTLNSRIAEWCANLVPSPELRATVRLWAMYAFAVVVVSGGLWAALQIRETVESDDAFYLDSWGLEFQDFPSWMTPEIQDEVMGIELTDSGRRLSLFEKGVLNRLSDILLDSPWIYSVNDIRLEYPTPRKRGMIGANLSYRCPVAIIHASDGFFYLVDWEGMRLGEPYDESPRDWFGVPVIRRNRVAQAASGDETVPAAGEYWSSRDILEGIKVANLLYREGIHRDFPHRPIEVIDVSNVDGRLTEGESEIALLCDGLRLEWGRSPSSRNARTLDKPSLLKNLRGVLTIEDIRPLRGRKIALYYEKPVTELMQEG